MRDWPSLALRFPGGAGDALQDLVAASLDPIEVAAIEERTTTDWLVSFRDASARDAAARDLRSAWAAAGLAVESMDVSDEDWARRSQASLEPVRVGRLVIAPPWHDASLDMPADAIRLVIEPSMGFGSGHHATTRLCLEALQSLDLSGARVLDIGTGSGILAIAAARLGAASVLAIDNDPDALDAARDGAAVNGPFAALSFRDADFRTSPPPPADIVLANLTGAMLVANVDGITACVAPGGHLILSGITASEAADVEVAFAPRATTVWRREEAGWVGLLLSPVTP